MKNDLLRISVFAFFGSVILAFGTSYSGLHSGDLAKNKKSAIISCSPDWESLEAIFEETDIPPIPGAGNYAWKITTTSDSAQFYFNQGISMYYSFHIIEAMASFKKAVKFDPESAMLYWAQALAYGPNINDLGYAASPEALASITKAVEKSMGCTEVEKLLIHAQEARYSADSTISRELLNQRYADEMKAAYGKYESNPDVASLYADALMLQHPWDLWNNDGTPKAWTPEIRQVLEKLLSKTPEHPGANHYYIHVMEPSPYFAQALPSADRLGKLTPGLSHTVHMPSHIYLRSGHYKEGSLVNETAVDGYREVVKLYSPVSANDFLYVIHNLHMQTNNAMLAGRSGYSARTAQETVNSISKDYLAIPGALGNYFQYIYMVPVLSHIRFGNWKELENYPEPAKDLVYARLLWHFGKGMSYAARGKITEARKCSGEVKKLVRDSSLLVPLTPFSAAIEGATVASNLLDGTISMAEKNLVKAIQFFQTAVTRERNMVYTEPRDWLLSPGHYLGNALFRNKQYNEAVKAFEKDLEVNNENPWALYGMWQALTAQKKTKAAGLAMNRFKKASSSTDVKINAAVF